MDDVHEFIAVGRTRRNQRKPSWLIIDMIVVYALLIVEESISFTYREAEISSESKMWKDAMVEEEFSVQKRHLGTDRVAKEKEGNWL